MAFLSASVVVISLCAARLISYGYAYFSNRQTLNEMKTVYYTDADFENPEVPQNTIELTEETPLPEETIAPVIVKPLMSAASSSDKGQYPGNHTLAISKRFQKIRRQNKDIIGWLRMEDILDQAVVHRDNSYYLRRDYQGYHNENGALFLDGACTLEKRPSIYMIWGHNMKTGAMFGSLRQFEDTHFYHSNPFITFDTMYEDGEFVIFAVCDLSVSRIADAILLENADCDTEKLIRYLISASLYTCPLDVSGEDQLLMLVTCTGDDDMRRAVIARRIRKNETKEALKTVVSKSKKQ